MRNAPKTAPAYQRGAADVFAIGGPELLDGAVGIEAGDWVSG
jgi:hypothetical protein